MADNLPYSPTYNTFPSEPPVHLIAIANRVADDLELIAALPAEKIGHVLFHSSQPDPGNPMSIESWDEEWNRFAYQYTPETQELIAAAAWLRSLPDLANQMPAYEHGKRDWDEVDEVDDGQLRGHVLGWGEPGQWAPESVLQLSMFADADVIAYRRFSEADGVRAVRAYGNPGARALVWAWQAYVDGDPAAFRVAMDGTRNAANRFGGWV